MFVFKIVEELSGIKDEECDWGRSDVACTYGIDVVDEVVVAFEMVPMLGNEQIHDGQHAHASRRLFAAVAECFELRHEQPTHTHTHDTPTILSGGTARLALRTLVCESDYLT